MLFVGIRPRRQGGSGCHGRQPPAGQEAGHLRRERQGDRPAQREDRGLRGRAPALRQRRPF